MFQYSDDLKNGNGSVVSVLAAIYRYLRNDINEIPDVIMGDMCNPRMNSDKRAIMQYLHYIENVNFLNSETIIHNEHFYTTNAHYQIQYESRFRDKAFTGIIIQNSSLSSQYNNFINNLFDVERLEAAEENIKQKTAKNMYIFTIADSNYLFVSTNDPLTELSLLKLYAIKLRLLENKLPCFEPATLDMIIALINEDKEALIDSVNRIKNNENLKNYIFDEIARSLKSRKSRLIENLKEQISACKIQIKDTRENLARALSRLNDKNIQFKALMNGEDTFDPQLIIRYLKKCPYIQRIKMLNSSTIRISYLSPLIYFDDYILEKIMDKREGMDYEIFKLFYDQEYELMSRCSIDINTEDFTVTQGEYLGSNLEAMSHPHIDQYNCFGNHEELIAEAAENDDMLYVLEEVTQATLNINFSDSIVIDTMLRMIKDHSELEWWREKETGAMYSTDELIG